MSSILYRYGRNVYINLTNRCPCDCTFCYRNLSNKIGDSDNLWLKEEPSVDDVMEEILALDPGCYNEVVFCGYGEPTERLDALLEIARRVRSETGKKVRLDTNGLGCILNGRDIVPDLAAVLDSISISLNAPDAEIYGELCRPEFGAERSYSEILDFIRRCKAVMDSVTVSVVGGTMGSYDEGRCRTMASEFGVRFRVRD